MSKNKTIAQSPLVTMQVELSNLKGLVQSLADELTESKANKATLSFQLPDYQDEFNDAVNAGKYKLVIEDLDMKLRNLVKHNDRTMIKIDEVRKMIYELQYEYEV